MRLARVWEAGSCGAPNAAAALRAAPSSDLLLPVPPSPFSLSRAPALISTFSLSLSLSLSLCISLFSLTADLIERQGVPLETALALLRRVLPPTAILVGQNIGKDVEWLGLREGVDFASMVDLTGLYRVWNEQYKSFR